MAISIGSATVKRSQRRVEDVLGAVRLLFHTELRRRWRDIDLTVQEGLDRLASLCVTEVRIGGRASYNHAPTPREDVRRLFEAARIAIPTAMPLEPARVATRQKLPQRRKAA